MTRAESATSPSSGSHFHAWKIVVAVVVVAVLVAAILVAVIVVLRYRNKL